MLALFSAALSIFALVPGIGVPSINVVAVTSFAIFAVLLWLKRDNLLFFARTFFLGLIGYFPILSKVLFGPQAYFSIYEPRTQGMETVVVMYVATSLALLGNEIGLRLAKVGATAHAQRPAGNSHALWTTVFLVSVPVVLLMTHFVTQAYAHTVFTVGYGMTPEAGVDTTSQALPLGNVTTIGVVCLLAMFAATLREGSRPWLYVFLACSALFIVYAIFLRGHRQEVLSPLFGLVVCYGLVKGRAVRVSLRLFVWIVVAALVFEAWGLLRSTIAMEGVHVAALLETILWGRFSGEIIQFGTVSPISTTFANIVWLVDTRQLDLTLGQSYWEFFLRTPPEFLYPDRPRDYAWIFLDFGLGSGGGFFELAEAYMNFGLLGALIVPGVISFVLAKSFYNAIAKQTVFSYFLLFGFLATFFRGTWYQTFAFYKGFLTAVILYFFFLLAHRMLTGACAHARRAPPVRPAAATG